MLYVFGHTAISLPLGFRQALPDQRARAPVKPYAQIAPQGALAM